MRINKLIEQSINGDQYACEKLLNHYDKMIYNYALKLTQYNHAMSDEVAQLARIRIFRSITNFKKECNFTTWMYRIVHNVCIDNLRKIRKNEISLDDCVDNPFMVAETDILKDLIAKETQNRLNSIVHDNLSKLPDASNEILNQYYFQDKTYREIGEDLKIPEGTVKSRLSRAKYLFVSKIDKEYNEMVCA